MRPFLTFRLNTVTVSPTPMEQAQIPDSGNNVKTNIPTIILGLALATGITLLMVYYLGQINKLCCGLGFLMIACAALYIPKMFGFRKTQYLAIFGIFLFIVIAIFGTFCCSKPMFEKASDYSNYNSEGFTAVNFVYENGNLTVTVNYEGPGEVTAYLYKIKDVDTDKYESKMTKEGTIYTCTFNNIPTNYIYQYCFQSVDGDNKTTSSSAYYLDQVDKSELIKISFIGNLLNAGTIIAIFYLMLVLTAVMRRNLEKTRARMEAEGRLYPQGYGRCKECGSIVLPGETCCRKCGAYIDVPDEFRHKKVDMVECSECGAEIPEDAKVCPKCGATFDEEEEVVYVDSEEKKE